MGQLIIDTIYVLIAIACVVGLYYLVIWVLDYLGIPVPQMVLRIVFLILGLLILAWVVSIFIGGSMPTALPPPRR